MGSGDFLNDPFKKHPVYKTEVRVYSRLCIVDIDGIYASIESIYLRMKKGRKNVRLL